MKDKYIVVSGSALLNSPDFQREINEKIIDGYIPLGGVSVTSTNQRTYFYQSMVFSNEKDFFKCPECGGQVEQYNNHIYGCSNEDCLFQIEKIK